MELKTKYQYTYFIHPFAIKEKKYTKYLLKLLKDKNFKLKIFQKAKDLEMYQYFLPKVNDFLFSSFSFSNSKIKKLEELPEETRAAILGKSPCTVFEYSFKKDIQGKTEENSIFFRIQKIEIICFQSGICFLCMKTNIEDSQSFSDVLNFNYKFREIRQEYASLSNYDNIRLQTDSFSDAQKLTEFIDQITGSKVETLKLDIDTQRFLTYSYVCIDQQSWNNQKEFENIEAYYYKFANFLPADNAVNFEKDQAITFSKWKYAKIGITKKGVTLFTSDADMNNYTILPDTFEREYFYTYILNLYKKLYLKKLKVDFKMAQNLIKARKRFIEFTKNLWIQEVTEDEVGSCINHDLGKVLELDRLYFELKNQYDVLYKEYNIEKNTKVLVGVGVILVIMLLLNIVGYTHFLGGSS